jgi:hypothetical protein
MKFTHTQKDRQNNKRQNDRIIRNLIERQSERQKDTKTKGHKDKRTQRQKDTKTKRLIAIHKGR